MSIGEHTDITALMDWSDGELIDMSELSTRYSGTLMSYEVVPANVNEFSMDRTPMNFCEGSLIESSRQKAKCSTSWATAAVEVAEAALDHRVDLSVEQLLQCLPRNEGVNGCRGIHPKSISLYLSEVGLVSKEDFIDCDSLDNQKRYTFDVVKPESLNAGGLMNLIAEGKPVFTMAALDLTRLRFIKDMSKSKKPHTCGAYQPSLYGILSGYKYDVDNIEESYWEFVTHIIGCEEAIVRIPLIDDMTSTNYGGVAAYAFSLRLAEGVELPTTEPPTTEPPTPAPIPELNVTITHDQYENLDDIPVNATTIIITGDNCYNTPEYTHINLNRFPYLRILIVGDDCFWYTDTFHIDGLQYLELIVVGRNSFTKHKNDWGSSNAGPLNNKARSFSIKNCPKFENLTIGRYSFDDYAGGMTLSSMIEYDY